MQSVSGAVEVMPVEDVLAWLVNRKLHGRLIFSRGNVQRSFVIREGLAFQGSSSDTREYLGQHLINFGYITEDQLEKGFATQRETKIPLGQILIMVGQIDAAQLVRALSFKVRESLLDSFEWRVGSFEFIQEQQLETELDLDLPVSLAEVHSEGQSRRSLWKEMRKIMPSGDLSFEIVKRPDLRSGADQALLNLIESGSSISDLLLEMRALEFHIYSRLYDLLNRGHIRILDAATEASTAEIHSDKSLREQMTAAMQARDFVLTYSLAQAVLDDDPHDAEALAATRVSAPYVVDQVQEQAISLDMVPSMLLSEKELSGRQFNAKERYVISRINGERNLRRIIQVSPISEAEFIGIIQHLLLSDVVSLNL